MVCACSPDEFKNFYLEEGRMHPIKLYQLGTCCYRQDDVENRRLIQCIRLGDALKDTLIRGKVQN